MDDLHFATYKLVKENIYSNRLILLLGLFVIFILLLLHGIYNTYLIQQNKPEIKVVEKIVEKPIIKTVVKEVEVPKEIIKEIQVPCKNCSRNGSSLHTEARRGSVNTDFNYGYYEKLSSVLPDNLNDLDNQTNMWNKYKSF